MFIHQEQNIEPLVKTGEISPGKPELSLLPSAPATVEESDIIKNEWDRLDNEPEKVYTAFSTFLSFGPGRSYGKVALKSGMSKQAIYKWSKKYNWLRRAESYDHDKFLEAKQAIMNSNSGDIQRSIGNNMYLAQRANALIPALIPFLEMFYRTYNNADAHNKLDYIIKACRAIKHVKSLANFNPLSQGKEDFAHDAVIMEFVDKMQEKIAEPFSAEDPFNPTYYQEMQYRETFSDSLKRPDFRKSMWDIDETDSRRSM